MKSNRFLHLHTFGGLRLTRGEREIRGAGTRRKPLAALAFLAANPHGASRDKLAACLWPEADAESARSVLRQTIYSLRRDLEAPDLIVGSTELRLNPNVVTSDRLQFEEALDRNDFAGAAALYRGPFLDGVHLPDSAEFERWQETERGRCEVRVRAAVESLATRANEEGDKAVAVRLWTRLTELDPLSGRAAVGLMKALVASGDAARALRHADEHARFVRKEIGATADASVTNLANQLRSEVPQVSTSAAAPPAVVINQEPTAASDAPAENPGALSARRFFLPRRRTAMTMAIPAIVVAVLVESGFPSRRGSTGDTSAESHASATTTAIAVLPFQVASSDATVRGREEGLNDLLAAKLSGVTGLTIIDPQAGVSALARSSANGGEGTLGQSIDVGRRLGAQQVITGTIASLEGRLQLTARLTDVPSASVLADVAAAAPADSLMSVVDHLAAELLTLSAGESPARLNSITQSPLSAVKAYLSGQIAYRHGRYNEASDRFKEALQLDSTLALAAFRLALSSGSAGRPAAEHDSSVARAWADRARLIPRDFAFLKAFATGRIPQLHASRGEMHRRWEDAIAEVPDWPEVWNEYGDFFFHSGTGTTRAAAAFRRALELDSLFLPAIPHALQLAALAGDTSSVRRLAARHLSRDSTSGAADYIRWRTALALDDSATIRRIRATLSKMPRETLRWIINAAHFDGVGTSDATAAAQALVGRAGSTEELIEGYQFSHDVALNAGRPDDALAALAGIDDAAPATHEADRWRVLDALYSIGDSAAAQLANARIAGSAEGPTEGTPFDKAMQYRNMCVHAQWQLSQGDFATVRRTISRLTNVDNPNGVVPQWAYGEVAVCRALLRAMLSAFVAPTELRRNLAILDSLTDAASPGEALGYFPIARSRLSAQRGDTGGALTAVRSRIYFAFNAPYIATQLRDEARYALVAGDTVGALRALRHYLALRHTAVGHAKVEFANVQALVARLDRN